MMGEQLHITADKGKSGISPNCLRQLLLSANRYTKKALKLSNNNVIETRDHM